MLPKGLGAALQHHPARARRQQGGCSSSPKLHKRPKPGLPERWISDANTTPLFSQIPPPAPCLCPRPRGSLPFPSFPQKIGRLWTRLPSSDLHQASSSPPPNQKASPPAETQIHSCSVDPDAAGARRAPGRDTTKRIPPILSILPFLMILPPQPRRFYRLS